ncbi:MAG: SMC-Scp complex subunit ScpB [Ruminococcaceae bacterium]|nr:SMC-Scp complex subunit ScpB [Oscillospiraceae bacterium]
MKLKEAEAIIEGVLFAAGDAVEIERIADILDIDLKSTRALMTALIDKYDEENRGLQIIRLEEAYQMCTRAEYHEYIARLAEPRRAQSLSNAAMEVLSIIAYKQPVTRSVIEQIRGVSCDALVNRLLERGLIEEVGRMDTPGRPMLFGTTEEFLRCFGIGSVTDLPEYEKNSSDEVTLEGEDEYFAKAAEVTAEIKEEERLASEVSLEEPQI